MLNEILTYLPSYISLYYSCGNKVIFLVTFNGGSYYPECAFCHGNFSDALLPRLRDISQAQVYVSFIQET